MQTLRKKNSPCKFKNEPTRFLGEGVSFKAKLIGILEVSEARGDRMCQAALADLKMAIRAAGEHKQRIAVQVSIDGLRLQDEKTGNCLYHHPVHKISFIAQDMSDSRAFGYIFGSPDTGHRFFGIKTDKAASQVVIAMRDLFQVVFELKKKEIELAKQHIEQNAIKFHTSGIFVEPAPDTKGAAGSEISLHRTRTLNSEVEKAVERKQETQSGVIADLLDLQFELNSLQQGIHQMDKITPDNPRPSSEDPFEADPFGDSFANMKVKDAVQPILPPPPSSATKRGHLERQQTVPATTTSSMSGSVTTLASKTPPPQGSVHWFDKETENLFSEGELSNLTKNSNSEKDKDNSSSSTTPNLRKSPQIDVFTELDPLGTGLIKPYVDKKDFFQHLKNPPKKVLKDLVTTCSGDTFPTNFNIVGTEPVDPVKMSINNVLSKVPDGFEDNNFADFDKFEGSEAQSPKTESPRTKREPIQRTIHHQPLSVSLPPEDIPVPKTIPVTYAISNTVSTISAMNKLEKESTEPIQSLVRLPSPKKYLQSVRKRDFDIDLAGSRTQSLDRPFPVDFSATSDSPASPLRSCSSDANSRLSSSSTELDIVPEPPPRGTGSILINPPPLPPKKQGGRSVVKPPPRPPYTEGHFHYDFLEREEASPSPTRKGLHKSPVRDSKNRFDDDFSPPPQLPKRSELVSSLDPTSKFEDSFDTMTPTTLSSFLQITYSSTTCAEARRTKPSLDITLSQLTSANLAELAASLDMSISELTNLTLQQLTECLATLSAKEVESSVRETDSSRPDQATCKAQTSTKVVETSFVSSKPLYKTSFDQDKQQADSSSTYDKYAVFRELLELEQFNKETREDKKKEGEMETSERSKSPEMMETESEDNAGIMTFVSNVTVKLPLEPEDTLKTEMKPEFEEEYKILSEVVEGEERKTDEREIEAEDKETERYLTREVEMKIIDEASREEEEEEEEEEKKKRIEATEEDNEGKAEVSENEKERNDNSLERIEEMATKRGNEVDESTKEKVDLKSSASTSSDKYAALREIIEETEQMTDKTEEEPITKVTSPAAQAVSKTLTDVDLMSLFSSSLPPPASPKRLLAKKEDDLNVAAMDIFEEIKMLNSGIQHAKDAKLSSSGFEDVFSPFPDMKSEKEIVKDDGNWAKFDGSVFHSDKSSGEGPGSVGGTSPWSLDGKDFHKEPPFKINVYRHSGDSDNEWKDEEESEESNGRVRDDGFWSGKPPRFEPGYEERPYYDESPVSGDKERGFRDRTSRRSRGAPWGKSMHRSRDPSPWHEEGRWEEEHRRYNLHRKVPYKDEEEYKAHWKCRSKQRPWNGEREGYWGHDHPSYEEERSKRRIMLWSEEDRDRDRFSSQESMGYEDEERWSRREYERRRWEEDGRCWGRRGPESDYPYRESYRKHEAHYCRDSRDRSHEYPPGWAEEEYGQERGADSPRYLSRKRHWPKRPSSATEGRKSDPVYANPRPKYGISRSECSDNDSDPYHRPHRSRSRESYWGSDQEFDNWGERPYWSEGQDPKTETFHRKRVNRHRPRPQTKSQSSPFEDDFTQSLEHSEPDPFVTESRASTDVEPKEMNVATLSPRDTKEPLRNDPRLYKRSGFFEDDLTPTASVSSDTSDRQRLSSDLKVTPEEIPQDAKDPPSADGFVSEDSGRDSFFNGDLRFDDDAFVFKSELEDNVPDRATTLSLRNSRQTKCGSNKMKIDQYIKKSESVNIFVRENDPFDDDDFFK